MEHGKNNVWWWKDAFSEAVFNDPIAKEQRKQRAISMWRILAWNQPENPPKCFCWEVMNGYSDWIHCPKGCVFWEKPDHTLWWRSWVENILDWDEFPKNSKTNDFHLLNKPFERVKLDTKDVSHRNLENTTDWEVFLEWFETNWESIILKLSILQRTESYKVTHVWNRWWNRWERNGEQIKTVKTKTNTNIKNIRVELISHPDKPWYKKISSIYAWKSKNGTKYETVWTSWHPVGKDSSKDSERYWLPFNKRSIREICIDAMNQYKSYME